jgi:hypothetical protein
VEVTVTNRVGAQRARVNGSGVVLTPDGVVKRDVPDAATDFEDILDHSEVDDDGTDTWDGSTDGDVQRRRRPS